MKRKVKPARQARKSSKKDKHIYRLQLYVTGQTPRSLASVRNLRHVCEEYLTGNFQLDVIDIYQQPQMASEAQIIAAPTLVKQLPLPLRRLVGDLSNERRVLMALDLKFHEPPPPGSVNHAEPDESKAS
jgi:circadian clock protein KaiB